MVDNDNTIHANPEPLNEAPSPEVLQDINFANITEVSIPDGENPRSPTTILTKYKAGQIIEHDSGEIVKKMGPSSEQVAITASCAFHIYETHLAHKVPGSQFPEDFTLGRVIDLIEKKFDFDKIYQAQIEPAGVLGEHKYVGTEDVGIEFTTGVATTDQMLDNGIVTSEQLNVFNQFKDRIREVNQTGDQAQKTALQNEFNLFGYPIYLGQRFPGSPLLIFFDTQSIKTTEMAIVVRDGKLVTTMTGHHREPLPFPPDLNYLKNEEPDEYQKLLKLHGSDEAIQTVLNRDFEINSQDWLNAGFIKSKE